MHPRSRIRPVRRPRSEWHSPRPSKRSRLSSERPVYSTCTWDTASSRLPSSWAPVSRRRDHGCDWLAGDCGRISRRTSHDHRQRQPDSRVSCQTRDGAEVTAAPSLDEAVGRLAPRVAGGSRGASQRLIVLLAATLLLVAALGTAIAVGSGILRLPWGRRLRGRPSVDLGDLSAPVAGQIVYCTNSGLWAVDPSVQSAAGAVRLEAAARP